jgi:hypothetical protein
MRFGLLIILGLLTYSQNQASAAAPTVLVTSTLTVGFARPPDRGTYRWQIFDNGAIQRTDNKGIVSSEARLSPEKIAKLKMGLNRITSVTLKHPTTPPCMNAPGSSLLIHQADGKALLIWKREGCRDSVPVEDEVKTMAGILQNLESSLEALDQLKNY